MVNPTKDGVSKDLLGNNENFASVFNYFLYKGEKRIRPGRLHDVHIEHRFLQRMIMVLYWQRSRGQGISSRLYL